MESLKRVLKFGGRMMGFSALSKPIAFQWQYWEHAKKNRAFKKAHPTVNIPPDKWLFETFQINYAKYFSDGSVCAKEIIEWTLPFLPEQDLTKILDWGCGTGRVAQHIHCHAPYSLVYGVDKNPALVEWNHQNIKGVLFLPILGEKIPFPNQYFQLVYGISVFTHLPLGHQVVWLEELARTIQTNGILLLSTHGRYFEKKLNKKQLAKWNADGFVTVLEGTSSLPEGDRNYGTYQDIAWLKDLFEPHFNLLQVYPGKDFPQKMGGQDLWILQKK